MCTVTALIFETVGLFIWNYTLNPGSCPAFPTTSYEKRGMEGQGSGGKFKSRLVTQYNQESAQ